MKKKFKILVLVFFVSFLIAYFGPDLAKEFLNWRNKKGHEAQISICSLPEEQGINTCCYQNNEWNLCNDKEVFKCGEKIQIRIKLEDIDTPSYLCIRQGFHPSLPIHTTDWTMLYEDSLLTCSEDSKPDPDVLISNTSLPTNFLLNGIVYETKGTKTLVEVLTFPIKNYLTMKDLVADLGNSKSVLKLEKEIICD